jgi:hypothetical protein
VLSLLCSLTPSRSRVELPLVYLLCLKTETKTKAKTRTKTKTVCLSSSFSLFLSLSLSPPSLVHARLCFDLNPICVPPIYTMLSLLPSLPCSLSVCISALLSICRYPHVCLTPAFDPCYHLECDNMDNVNIPEFDLLSRAAAYVLEVHLSLTLT